MSYLTVRYFIALAIAAALSLPSLRDPCPDSDIQFGDRSRDSLLDDLNETSSGLASGAATPDGRPLLWKSRDRDGVPPNECLYYDNGSIPFIGITTDNHVTECYGGLNAEGFALENTDAHNVAHGPHYDGLAIFDALSKCRTVDDFEVLLDSADLVDEQGRWGYNYGVIDAYGGAAIIEAYRFGHRRYDAVDAPDGILIRSNFAYGQGEPDTLNPSLYGSHRHKRSMGLFKRAHESGTLSAEYIFKDVARDLTSNDFDPYPLPFRGYYGQLPYGFIDNNNAICRERTTAVIVAQGVRAGERPDDAILWTLNGSPLTGIMTPLWVRAGSVPGEYFGERGGRINSRIKDLYNTITHNVAGDVDTWLLTNPYGTGLWDFLLPLEHHIFQKSARFLRSPEFHYDRLAAFQQELAQQIADSLDRWRPTYKVTEVTGRIFWNSTLTLTWGEPEIEEGGLREAPYSYDIYRCSEPFRDGVAGEMIGATSEREFTDNSPLERGGYYQVVGVFY